MPENLPLTMKRTGMAMTRTSANPIGNSGTPEEGVIWNVVVDAAEENTGDSPLGSCVAKFQQTTT